MTYTEFTLFHAAGLDYIDKVSKRAVEIIFHAEWKKSVLKSVSNRTNSWYSRKSLDAYMYSVSIFLSFN